jgi:hypothetical protein
MSADVMCFIGAEYGRNYFPKSNKNASSYSWYADAGIG